MTQTVSIQFERVGLFGFALVAGMMEVDVSELSVDSTGLIVEGEVCDAEGNYLADLDVSKLSRSEREVKLTKTDVEHAEFQAYESFEADRQAALEDKAEARRELERGL